eukprot:COSAG06_NODE_32096_length_511_cov_0.995146_1_plen_50_part_10
MRRTDRPYAGWPDNERQWCQTRVFLSLADEQGRQEGRQAGKANRAGRQPV